MKKLLGLLVLLSVGCSKTKDFTKTVEEALPKTVTIYVSYPTGTAIGAGAYVSRNGHVLTCAHLFTAMSSSPTAIAIENYDGTTVAGDILYIRSKDDMALVATSQENTSCIRLADTRDLKVGQEVFAIGAPLGNTFSVSKGIISALHRDAFLYNALQTDTSINPGNSGGALFNLAGELVGINSFIESPVDNLPIFTGLGFSIESGQLSQFLATFRGLSDNKSFELPKYRRDMTVHSDKLDSIKKQFQTKHPQHRLPYLKGKIKCGLE